MSKEVQEEAKEPKVDNGLAKFSKESQSLLEILRIVQQDTLRIDPDYHKAAKIVSGAADQLSTFVVDGGR